MSPSLSLADPLVNQPYLLENYVWKRVDGHTELSQNCIPEADVSDIVLRHNIPVKWCR